MKCAKLLLLIVFVVLAASTNVVYAGEIQIWTDESAASVDSAYRYHPFRVPEEIVVDFKDNTPIAEIEKMERDLGVDFRFVSKFSQDDRLMTASVPDLYLEDLLRQLRKNSQVEYAEPDYYYHAFAPIPNDPLYRYQWHLEKINVRGAWDFTKGDNVTVAVIDTGIAYRDYGRFHQVEDLNKTLFVKGYNFIDKNELPLDDNAHGTHVAGTIAQSTNNGRGVAGAAYRAKLMPLKVLSSAGFGRVSDIADAVRYAADHDAKVINMSLGGPFPSFVLESACNYAWNKGVVIVCAAGNSRSTRPSYPASYKVCLSVSATRYDDKLAPYSNRGPRIDIAAPGGDTRVDQNKDGKPDGVMQNTIAMRDPEKEGYYIFQGTSMAAPHVAAAAALVASTGVTSNKEIVSILKKTARRRGLSLLEGYGSGIVDARAAVVYSTIWRGWIKLIIAIIILIIIILLFSSIFGKHIKYSPQFYLGLIGGSCGLFFLPLLLGGRTFPGISFLMRGISDWDLLIFGIDAHANPLFFSVLPPFLLAVFLYRTRLQKVAAGFSIGTAASLLYGIFFSSADVRWIPGTFILDKLWLLINAFLCIFLAYVLVMSPNKKGKDEKGVIG